MFTRRPLGATRDRLAHPRPIQTQVAPNFDPVNRDTRILANDHILIAPQFDGFDVVGEDPLGDFFGLGLGRLANGRDDIWRNFLQRLNVQIAADVLDQVIETIRDFHQWLTITKLPRRSTHAFGLLRCAERH